MFNLIPSDVGRPIRDIKPNITTQNLPELIDQVIATLTPFEGLTHDADGHPYCLRIRPYVTTENVIDGASIVLLDIDSISAIASSRG